MLWQPLFIDIYETTNPKYDLLLKMASLDWQGSVMPFWGVVGKCRGLHIKTKKMSNCSQSVF